MKKNLFLGLVQILEKMNLNKLRFIQKNWLTQGPSKKIRTNDG